MFTIEADFHAAERLLSDLGRRQLPFAAAMTLNDVAADVKEDEARGIEETFDRPAPFTKRGLYLRRASKSRLAAQVGVKPVQSGYLGVQAKGGVRRPKGRALVVPVKMRRNKYGNMAKGAVKRAAAKRDVFVASRSSGRSRHLPPGLYQRSRGKRGGSPKMLVAFEASASYRKRWDFQGRAQKKASAVAQAHFSRRLAEAIRTAK
ncbi:hypothetical protein MALG_01644 [Marinovum algicola DG 898]|nr:hypothetical protein MALG_01644 [Marinovum algicola DG 898]